MPTLVIPKTYRDGSAPRVIDLDNIRLTLETFFNTTKVDATNINLSSIASAVSASESRTLITNSECMQTVDDMDSTGSVSYTIVDTGVYIVYVRCTRSLQSVSIGSGDSSTSSDINIAINGVNTYDLSLDSYYRAAGAAAITYNDYGVGSVSFISNFTEGDVISVEDTTDPTSLSVIKLLET